MSNKEDSISLPLVHKGKVRDVYNLGKSYLIVASDRISAFDYVIPTIIPDKGRVLHKLSMFWFDFIQGIVPNHIITGNFESFPLSLKQYEYLRDRSMIVKKAKRVDIECIVRGYLAGSGWKEYQKSQTVCGIKLPVGLKESSKLPESVFTPSSKEEGGKHDENISFEEMVERVGKDTAESLRRISLELYKKVSDYSFLNGIILADTKLEFGFYDNQLILIDEIFTPDSSRFWETGKYEEGKSQDSLDKQYVRDYLERIKWDKSSPAPELPKDVVEKTMEKYISVYEKLTGVNF
ncbi:phosphoribosylaminoimidazole-succinocarboxamide synthase [Endomicrobiia bacterium]|uniref:phosphoribosylaminoimidazolesuccinocarboxamide synthase n=1 Tax=Endomicrobium trichonymphae TaxID=1408204 RepID=UPI000865E5D6|nr:phosphoribosylaminoimidazolesuccinocarboxamide synthase [Candidatus Endomicrobium trichonymphae]GHT04668.1 phosphoribosylaminoimidazole-succinocarboxamide synthase [Endomicrobiia bacterium]BAV59293.1 phosphoribosylaminoimidazole-succinocarboxamide (SAICAR) synthase [Candidatus Endomicrobium trichonymphae]GHT07647.1 phosphoribosylaminoimidazole-succinocarboxamide synthase [Endomicrobiia bacterium]GHT11961.1 phosphoribosylaminoimidazole-succinocarboxamide synthase [Endomicrobiia bacterium]GHT